LVAVALFVVASAARAQAPKPPCTFLTAAQVGGEVGTAMGAGEPTGSNGCQWIAVAQMGSSIPRATLVFYGADAWSGMTANFPRVTKTTVTGLGDAAVYATTGNLTTLSVKKGNTVFVVRIYGIDGAEKQMAMEKALAEQVLGKL
jgi:hypothetical protein